jgi:hypothetical protein
MSISVHWSEWPARDRLLDPQGYLYVLEFTMGVVKVGKTNHPQMRALQHARDVGRFAGSIQRWWLSDIHLDYHATERELIQAAAQAGRQLTADEYFADCSFDAMVSVARRLRLRPALGAQRHQATAIAQRRKARQVRVMELKAAGMTERQIATALDVSPATAHRDLVDLGLQDVHRAVVAVPQQPTHPPLAVYPG